MRRLKLAGVRIADTIESIADPIDVQLLARLVLLYHCYRLARSILPLSVMLAELAVSQSFRARESVFFPGVTQVAPFPTSEPRMHPLPIRPFRFGRREIGRIQPRMNGRIAHPGRFGIRQLRRPATLLNIAHR